MGHLINSVSGIRGIYGDSLTDTIVERFACAFGKMSGGTIVIGRDSRKSGPALAQAVISGLNHAGADVIDLGIASTPTSEMAVIASKASGGVIITASHNPAEWNGLKFIGPDGVFISADRGRKLTSLLETIEPLESASSTESGVTTWDDADTYHCDAVLGLDVIDPERIAAKNFTVCLDAVNGAGGKICKELLERLGCTVFSIHTEPSGDFPRGAEPVPENLGDLCMLVGGHGADVGFAVDPDVDRLSIVNERGEAIGEEYTLALAADFIFGKTGGPAAVNLSTSQMIDDAASRHGTTVFRSPVGEIHVVETMREHNAAVGGEGNGGIILPELHYGRDAVLGIALILQLMSEREKTIGALAGEFRHYIMIKEKKELKEKGTWAGPVKKAFSGENMDCRDGVKIVFPSSWVHIRESNTEPVIRVIAEAPEEAEARSLMKRVYDCVL